MSCTRPLALALLLPLLAGCTATAPSPAVAAPTEHRTEPATTETSTGLPPLTQDILYEFSALLEALEAVVDADSAGSSVQELEGTLAEYAARYRVLAPRVAGESPDLAGVLTQIAGELDSASQSSMRRTGLERILSDTLARLTIAIRNVPSAESPVACAAAGVGMREDAEQLFAELDAERAGYGDLPRPERYRALQNDEGEIAEELLAAVDEGLAAIEAAGLSNHANAIEVAEIVVGSNAGFEEGSESRIDQSAYGDIVIELSGLPEQTRAGGVRASLGRLQAALHRLLEAPRNGPPIPARYARLDAGANTAEAVLEAWPDLRSMATIWDRLGPDPDGDMWLEPAERDARSADVRRSCGL